MVLEADEERNLRKKKKKSKGCDIMSSKKRLILSSVYNLGVYMLWSDSSLIPSILWECVIRFCFNENKN